jgi:hypothetical protein
MIIFLGPFRHLEISGLRPEGGRLPEPIWA